MLRTPWAIRRHGQLEAAAHALGAGPLPGVDGAAEAGVGGDLERLGVRAGRVVRLVACHREAHDVGVRALRRVARHPQRGLHAEVANAGDQDATLDAVLGVIARVVDPARDAVDVLLVREADELRVVGRRRELDVDCSLACALDQVLVRDVAVVLAGADHARGLVVGVEEVEEVAVGEAVRSGEGALGDGEAVALGDAADQVRRSGALEVDVELDFGDEGRGGAAPHRTTALRGSRPSPRFEPAVLPRGPYRAKTQDSACHRRISSTGGGSSGAPSPSA